MSDTIHTMPTVFQALQAVANDIKAIGKDRKNAQQNYNFRGIEDLYNHLHPVFTKHGVFTVPRVVAREHFEGQAKAGSANYRTVLEVEYSFFGPAGDCVKCVVTGEGSDTGDKSCNKAMASAHKYALTQVLCIPFVELDDSDSSSPDVNERRAPPARKSDPKLSADNDAAMLKKLVESVQLAKDVGTLADIWRKTSDEKRLAIQAAFTARRLEIEASANGNGARP